jgi:hypothetical protein
MSTEESFVTKMGEYFDLEGQDFWLARDTFIAPTELNSDTTGSQNFVPQGSGLPEALVPALYDDEFNTVNAGESRIKKRIHELTNPPPPKRRRLLVNHPYDTLESSASQIHAALNINIPIFHNHTTVPVQSASHEQASNPNSNPWTVSSTTEPGDNSSFQQRSSPSNNNGNPVARSIVSSAVFHSPIPINGSFDSFSVGWYHYTTPKGRIHLGKKMYIERLRPSNLTKNFPIVLIHGDYHTGNVSNPKKPNGEQYMGSFSI